MSNDDHSTRDMLRETASRLFEATCEPRMLRDAEQGIWPEAAWTALQEAGLHRALVPEAAGGFGVAVPDALSLLRVAAEHALPLPLAETMLASWLLAKGGLPIPDGPLTIAPVTIAPVTIAPATLAHTLEADGEIVKGEARRVPWGRNAVAAAVLLPRGRETLVALVPREAWTVEPEENIAREPRDTLRFNGAATALGVSSIDAPTLRAVGAVLRCQQIAGALVALTAMTTQYAQDRVQFGRPIGKFQAVQQNMAVLAGQAAAATAAADIAAEAIGETVSILPIAAAKARTGEAAGIGAAIAHQIHGAIGFTFEHRLHFLSRRLWSWRDEFGNEAEWNRLVGRHMAEAGAERLWAEIVAA